MYSIYMSYTLFHDDKWHNKTHISNLNTNKRQSHNEINIKKPSRGINSPVTKYCKKSNEAHIRNSFTDALSYENEAFTFL